MHWPGSLTAWTLVAKTALLSTNPGSPGCPRTEQIILSFHFFFPGFSWGLQLWSHSIRWEPFSVLPTVLKDKPHFPNWQLITIAASPDIFLIYFFSSLLITFWTIQETPNWRALSLVPTFLRKSPEIQRHSSLRPAANDSAVSIPTYSMSFT